MITTETKPLPKPRYFDGAWAKVCNACGAWVECDPDWPGAPFKHADDCPVEKAEREESLQ